jgi:predicted ferric reductase
LGKKDMPQFFKKNIGFISIIAICILPILRWIFIEPLNLRFFSFGITMSSFGQVSGLLGMILFSIVLILAGRFKFLDEYFYGLNKVYEHHHQLGAIAFSLLLFHPLFLVVNYITVSLRSAALFFLPFNNLAITYGIISLALMIFLIVLTFYIKLKYQNWKLLHKFMVLVFLFGVLHTIYIPSDISRDLVLRYFILSLALIGLAISFYQAFLNSFARKRFIYNIKRVTALNQLTMEIEMEPVSSPMIYQPGQFIFISFKNGVARESHPFSITSAPKEKNLELIIKNLGDFTAELKNLEIGSQAVVEGPYGKFTYTNVPGKKQIWIAGGVGITPFISMAKSIVNDYQIDLFYSTANSEEAVKVDDLINISKANNNFRVFPWYSKEKGRIAALEIKKLTGDLDNKEIFLCGPPVFMESMREQLLQLGVKKNNIHWEKFNF